MKITIPETVLRNDEVINIKKEKDVQPIIISNTIPLLIQDENGKWIRNPEYVECNNQL